MMASEDMDIFPGPSGEGTSASASSAAVAKRPKRFEIKKWNAVALWAWGMLSVFVSFLGYILDLCFGVTRAASASWN